MGKWKRESWEEEEEHDFDETPSARYVWKVCHLVGGTQRFYLCMLNTAAYYHTHIYFEFNEREGLAEVVETQNAMKPPFILVLVAICHCKGHLSSTSTRKCGEYSCMQSFSKAYFIGATHAM